MMSVQFDMKRDHALKILCLGAHCDDIEIGCGGTLLELLKKYRNADVHWVVFSSTPKRKKEATECAKLFLKQAGTKTIRIEAFRDGYFPYEGAVIKDYFEMLKKKHQPDVIFTHYRMDLHQDHRLISELTWNTYRNNLILEYEIPKYDGDFGTPNVFVQLDEQACLYKIRSILNHFRSQNNKHWLTENLLLSVMRIRGMECPSSTDYAEAFHCKKILFWKTFSN